MSYVTEFPAAEPQEAVTHFLRRLSVKPTAPMCITP
jgi:hypothetical protein